MEIAAWSPLVDYVLIDDAPGARLGMVCFHFAGGSAQSYFRWRHATAGCALVAAELPGRGRRLREEFAPSLHAAAAALASSFRALARDMAERRPGLSWVFFGHSLGALVAYETARLLGGPGSGGPDRLIVSARHGPGWQPASSGLPDLSDPALLDYLREMGGTPRVLLENRALMEMALPILRADLGLIYGYGHVPGPPLDIPILAIGASEDDRVPLEALVAWRGTTRAEFRLRIVSGGHFALLDQPGIVFDAALNG